MTTADELGQVQFRKFGQGYNIHVNHHHLLLHGTLGKRTAPSEASIINKVFNFNTCFLDLEIDLCWCICM